MLIKSHGIDDVSTLDWRELAAKRLAHLVENERIQSEQQQLVKQLRQEHYGLLVTLNEREQQIAKLELQLQDRESEIARLNLIANSWCGTLWFFKEWARKPRNWLALVKRVISRPLRLLARVRILRRLTGLALRLTPGLRARLLAMIDLP